MEINLTNIHEDVGLIPGLAQCFGELVLPQAVVQVTDAAQICCGCGCGVGRRYSSDWTSSLGTSMCRRCGPKKTKKKKKRTLLNLIVNYS